MLAGGHTGGSRSKQGARKQREDDIISRADLEMSYNQIFPCQGFGTLTDIQGQAQDIRNTRAAERWARLTKGERFASHLVRGDLIGALNEVSPYPLTPQERARLDLALLMLPVTIELSAARCTLPMAPSTSLGRSVGTRAATAQDLLLLRENPAALVGTRAATAQDLLLLRENPAAMLENAPKTVPEGSGDIFVIGRQVDTAVAKEWPGHKRLDIPDWTLAKNDAAIKAVINQKGRVYIGSPQNRATLWDAVNNRETVFARELRQFQEAGYKQVGDYLVPPD